jgi:ABC-2 type transport system ATP-binding protein
MDKLVVFQNVFKNYLKEVLALQDLSFELNQGECLTFLGPNGAGKTTTIKILCGLLSPTQGKVWVRGERFFQGSPLQKIFGVALQDTGLWPYLTVEETIHFSASLYRFSPKQIQERTEEILKELRLLEWRKRRVDSLSEGLKRRLNLAIALIHNPEILILDEPSSGLDPRARLAFWEYLEKILQKGKTTLFLSTHDMEEADRLSGRVGILYKGKLVALDCPQKLKNLYGIGDEISFDVPSGFSFEYLLNFPGMRKIENKQGRLSLFVLNGISRLPEIFSLLGQNGIVPVNLTIKPNTLGNVFLSLTGSQLEENEL